MKIGYRILAIVAVLGLAPIGPAVQAQSPTNPQVQSSVQAPSLPEPQIRHITLEGVGEAELPTDMAVVKLGMFIRDRSHAQAQGEADRRMRRLVSSLAKLGIKREQIRSRKMTVGAGYTKGKGSAEFADYCDLHSDLSVIVYDLAKLPEIIEDSLKAGINNVQEIKLHCSHESEIETQAAQLALMDAKRKALAMTKQMGNRLGKVQSVVLESSRIEPSLSTPAGPLKPPRTEIFLMEPLKIRAFVRITFQLHD